MTPISSQRTIRGIPSDMAVVVVSSSVIGRLSDARMEMGPGRCTSLVANDNGVFFQADKPVIMRSWIVLTPVHIPGGVFVPDDPSQPCKPYYDYDGTPRPVDKAEVPTTVTLIDTRTNKKTTLRME